MDRKGKKIHTAISKAKFGKYTMERISKSRGII